MSDARPDWMAIGFMALLFIVLAATAVPVARLLHELARVTCMLPMRLLIALLVAFFFVALNATLMHWFYAVRLAPQSWFVGIGLLVAAGTVGAAFGPLVGDRGSDSRRPRARAYIALFLGSGILISLALVLIHPGSHVPVSAAFVPGSLAPDPIRLPDPSLPGAYRIQALVYGSGNDRRRDEYGSGVDFRTRPIDGSKLIDGWAGRNKWMRDRYWGFDATALPLNGRLWVPVGRGPFPLVLIVHGNHSAESASENGYRYLGELLASRGYIAASVDENFLNTSDSDVAWGTIGPGYGLENENDARGWLLLEHLRQFQMWNLDPGHALFGRVDLDNVGLIGHSRGGESVAIAAAFNHLPAHPDDATIRFDFGFGIKAVIALASVDSRFQPSGSPLTLLDVNYLALQGSHDSDIYSFVSARQYERTRFTGRGPWFKALLYIDRANHSQFNSLWGTRDFDGLSGWLLNTRNLLPAAAQRRITSVYVSAFLDCTLRDTPGYRSLFESHFAGREWLPETSYVSRFASASDLTVADFDEDIDLGTGTLPGTRIDGHTARAWSERAVEIKNGALSKAAILEWRSSGSGSRVDVTWPAASLQTSATGTLVFSLADLREPPTENPAHSPIDLSIEVVDAKGQRASVPLSAVSAIPPQLPAQVNKLAYLNPIRLSEPVFQSYRIPLHAFRQRNELLDLSNLRGTSFRFDRSDEGRIAIDDVGMGDSVSHGLDDRIPVSWTLRAEERTN